MLSRLPARCGVQKLSQRSIAVHATGSRQGPKKFFKPQPQRPREQQEEEDWLLEAIGSSEQPAGPLTGALELCALGQAEITSQEGKIVNQSRLLQPGGCLVFVFVFFCTIYF